MGATLIELWWTSRARAGKAEMRYANNGSALGNGSTTRAMILSRCLWEPLWPMMGKDFGSSRSQSIVMLVATEVTALMTGRRARAESSPEARERAKERAVLAMAVEDLARAILRADKSRLRINRSWNSTCGLLVLEKGRNTLEVFPECQVSCSCLTLVADE